METVKGIWKKVLHTSHNAYRLYEGDHPIALVFEYGFKKFFWDVPHRPHNSQPIFGFAETMDKAKGYCEDCLYG